VHVMYRKGGEPRMEEENVARFQYVQFSVLCLSAGVRCQFEWKLPTRCSELVRTCRRPTSWNSDVVHTVCSVLTLVEELPQGRRNVVRPEGLEPPTPRSVDLPSIPETESEQE
jgi:hypothetical protein